jgi:hypothetical protein
LSSTLSNFEAWLWSLDDIRLSALRLESLARVAAHDGVALPPLTVLTAIGDGQDATGLIAARVGGLEDVRRTPTVSLIRARLQRDDHVVALFPAGPDVVHLIGTPPVTDDAWQRVETGWLNATAPHLAPVILNRSDFEAIGDALAEHGTIETARMTARVLRDHSSYSRGWPSITGYDRPTHREALGETDGMIVRTITVDVGSHTRVQVRRSGGASFYRGDFTLFVSIVLHRLKIAAIERREMLTGRERAPKAPVQQVLAMEVDRLDLEDRLVRDLLRETIAGVRGLQVATIHDNPYMHLLVTDFLNGTNFDVLVTDRHRVEIIPGLRSSVGSLARVTDALGDALGMKTLSLVGVDDDIPKEAFFGA